jgi:hypothetical protein
MHVIHVDEKCLEVKKIFVNKNAVVAKAHLFCIHHAFIIHIRFCLHFWFLNMICQ